MAAGIIAWDHEEKVVGQKRKQRAVYSNPILAESFGALHATTFAM